MVEQVKKPTPEERRRSRIIQLKNTVEKLKDVDLDDLYSEVSLMWGIRKFVFISYLEAIPKYIKIEKGRVMWIGKDTNESNLS